MYGRYILLITTDKDGFEVLKNSTFGIQVVISKESLTSKKLIFTPLLYY
jgi:hypothetical protein